MWLNELREKVNLNIYNSKNLVLSIFRVSHVFIALSMIGVLIYYYGFPQTPESKIFLTKFIKFSFVFYVVRFFIKLIYNFNPFKFLRENKFETVIIAFLVIGLILFEFFDDFFLTKQIGSIGYDSFADFSNIIIQIFFISYVISDIFKKRDFKQYFKIHPGLLFMLSILGIIVLGTGLLMLPEMTIKSYDISFIDALFLSTSSTSCTGLSTLDMGGILTLKGQLVVLFLIQAGALNTIAFVALYLLVGKLGVGLKQHDLIEDYVNSVSYLDSEKMFFRIVKWVLAIEFIGFVCIYYLVKPVGDFKEVSSRLYFSVYQSISSFCNAGIIMEPGGYQNKLLQENYLLQIVVIALFFLGGFGMIYLFDLFGIKSLRERMKNPWKTLRFDTKVTLYTSLSLIVVGALVFFFSEYNGVLEGKTSIGKFVTTLYNSMATRHTGAATVDFSTLGYPFLVFALFLMFVGASSGSAGGGIRVSTFAVLLSSVVATVKGNNRVELFKRTIDNSLVLKAYSILMIFVVGNLIGIFALTITENATIQAGEFHVFDLIYEHVSAASTSGLSTGLTENLTEPGKIIIILAMFIGRVGTLSIAYLFSRGTTGKRYKYPKGNIIVG